MRILFVAALTHVAQLRQAVAGTPPGETPPLFPPSMMEHFYERAFRRRGHELAIFWRERPSRNYRYRAGLTPGKVAQALERRLPSRLNSQVLRRNRQLLRRAREFKPDLLWLTIGNRNILPQTLASIQRTYDCRLVFGTGDSPLLFDYPFQDQIAPLLDLALVNDVYHGMMLRELGARRVVCLPLSGIDPDFHRPRRLDDSQRKALACDVAFVGTLLPEHLYGERASALAALREFDPGIWSVHDLPRELRPFLRGEALGEPMLDILSAARIAVNPHGQVMQYGGNMRLFEAAGVGTLQITDDRPGIRKWFTPGENIVTFRDERDLRDKVAYYLRHDEEREEIARKAREHVLAHHRYDQRVEEIERLLKATPGQRIAPGGARRPGASVDGGARDSSCDPVHGAPAGGVASTIKLGSGWSSPSSRARTRHDPGRLKLRILFIDSLTHVQELRQAVADTPPGETPPLFPSSMKEHFYERAFRRRGHELDVFWRERPTKNYRFRAGFTPAKAAQALAQRVPPALDPLLQRRNRELLQKTRQFKPDVLWLCGGNRNILPQTLATIRREQGCRILLEYGDSQLLFRFPFMPQLLSQADLVMVNDFYVAVQLRELGARRVVVLPVTAMDPDFHRPRRLDERQGKALACDVAFVGTLLPEHLYGERVRALAALRDFDLGIWSVHDAPPVLQPCLRGEALGEPMLDILSAAKVAVNPHGQVMQYGGNPRLFEAAGVGTLQITDDRPGIRKWFTPGENIITYRDERELRDKVAYYLAHDDEREEIARNAREHVNAHHRYDQRVEELERLLAAT